MGKARYRSPLIETPHKWLKKENADIWEYGNYKYCTLTVVRFDEGYKPYVNGCNNLHLDRWRFNDPRPLILATLEEAQSHCMKYMDQLRADEKRQSLVNTALLQSHLRSYVQSKLNP